MKKLIPKSKLKLFGKGVSDSLKSRKSKLSDSIHDLPLYYEARDVYLGFSAYRKTRLRNVRYVFGDQWGDTVTGEDGHPTTERDRISKRTGGVVLQNNHMFKVVNGMSGIYVKSMGIPVVYARHEEKDIAANMMTNALQTAWENNEESEVMTAALVEMLVGGLAVVSEEWANIGGRDDAYTIPIDPGYFAFRHKGADSRLWDIDMTVEIRDYTLGELKTVFAKNEDEAAQLDHVYAPYLNVEYPDMPTPQDLEQGAEWDRSPRRNLCRTYHVWTQEYKQRYRVIDLLDYDEPLYRIDKDDLPYILETNERRREEYRKQGITDEADMILIEYEQFTDTYWHCTIFGPEGIVIDEYDSPYTHGSHPYAIVAHQLVGGTIYPFMSIIVDQQRYINRLITLQDLYINSAIKGLKMVPKTLLGGLSPRQFAKRATELGGWIFYEPDERFPNLAPQIIQTQSRDIGVSELLKVQLDNINEITSYSAAARGSAPTSGTPAARYALETENAITSLAATFKKFNGFENRVAKKKLKIILQYYTTGRNISMWHTNGLTQYSRYDSSLTEGIDFEAVVRQAPDTPVARMTNNDLFKEMWLRGILTTQQLLKYSDLPGTEQLKQDLSAMEEQAQAAQAQQPTGAPQALSQQAAASATQGADTDTVSAIKSALRNDLGALTKL